MMKKYWKSSISKCESVQIPNNTRKSEIHVYTNIVHFKYGTFILYDLSAAHESGVDHTQGTKSVRPNQTLKYIFEDSPLNTCSSKE